mmetsp:Transcript_11302/g.12428  ORF Transcript_11302/g.12428 Transcript_11302/m.12428 type:complete len:172 (+) Transcript_11302:94-609(+)|eukprot:CAMPEP_0168512024 /NCGR_PEP_ID=MMETSP0405-20121227/2514_1 /TAXON_ID=498012 /ORGANISM="Trichosphaerium sp, Strain Am-I-7 wt" /LENGTH=171 /DNA_ID=CAMNT_0008530373 /DNA_START=1096 /DNA_END=1608 /DNA_ORIENTATION=+
MCFFHIVLKRQILMHPKYLGPKLQRAVRETLDTEVEGTCAGRHGFIIIVTDLEALPLGKVIESGWVRFDLTYSAIVFRPFVNQVIDAKVTTVDEVGFYAKAGPLVILVHSNNVPPDYSYDPVGPCYMKNDQSAKIEHGSTVRLKIIGVQFHASEIFAVGTIREDYMGLISN